MSGHGTPTGMSSARTTLEVLEQVARRQPIGVSDLARAMGLPKSTVQRCLITLRESGWLRLVDDRSRWGVTVKPLDIGLRAVGEDRLRDLARPHLAELRSETDETVHLTIRDGASLIIVAREDSTQPVRTHVDLGTRAPLPATACGLAVLAHLPVHEVDAVLARGLTTYTDATILDPDRLRAEIDLTRSRGYSVNATSWWRPQVCAIGSAVLGASGRPIGAVAVSVPSSRFDAGRVPELAAHAVHATAGITRSLDA